MLQLDSLRMFIEIVDHGSLAAVARARGIAPSTVTTRLQELEDHVGAKLLRRTTRALSMTDAGERLATASRRILADLDETLGTLGDEGALSGPIRLTATNDFGRAQVAASVSSFLRAHPKVAVELVLSDAVVDLVDQGFDLGLRMSPSPDARVQGRRLATGRRHVCAAPSYWKKHGRPKHPRELASHNCLVLERAGAPQRTWSFEESGRGFTVQTRGDRSSNDGGVLRTWALEGAGVTLKSEWDVAEDLAAGRLESVLDTFLPSEVHLYLLHPAERRPSRRIGALIEHLSETLPASLAGA